MIQEGKKRVCITLEPEVAAAIEEMRANEENAKLSKAEIVRRMIVDAAKENELTDRETKTFAEMFEEIKENERKKNARMILLLIEAIERNGYPSAAEDEGDATLDEIKEYTIAALWNAFKLFTDERFRRNLFGEAREGA